MPLYFPSNFLFVFTHVETIEVIQGEFIKQTLHSKSIMNVSIYNNSCFQNFERNLI
jgi:hypothetical protein